MSRKKLTVLNETTQSFTGAYCVPDAHGHCATCSDEALPAKVLEIHEMEEIALVDLDGKTIEVDVSLMEEVFFGQVLLVHGGVAVGSLSEEGQS